MVLIFIIYREKKERTPKNRRKRIAEEESKQPKPKHPSFLTFCPRQIKPLLCLSQLYSGDRPPCPYLAVDKSGSPLTLAGLQVLTMLI